MPPLAIITGPVKDEGAAAWADWEGAGSLATHVRHQKIKKLPGFGGLRGRGERFHFTVNEKTGPGLDLRAAGHIMDRKKTYVKS